MVALASRRNLPLAKIYSGRTTATRAKLRRGIALDTETTGLALVKNARAFSLALCDEEGKRWFWQWPVDPFTRMPDYDSKAYKVARDQILKIATKYGFISYHHAKFDQLAVKLCPGLEDILDIPWEDTQLLSHVIDSTGPHGLKPLAKRILGIDDEDQKELVKKVNDGRTYGRKHGWSLGASNLEDYWVPNEVDRKDPTLRNYNLRDVERSILLWRAFKHILDNYDDPALAKKLWERYEEAKQLVPVVAAMEDRGVTVNLKRLKSEIKRYSTEMKTAEETAVKLSGIKDINLNSPKQLCELLFTKWKVKPTHFTDTMQPSTGIDALKAIHQQETAKKKPNQKVSDFIGSLIAHRQNDKARGYLDSYAHEMVVVDSRVARLYPSFNQTGTVTTRFSSTSPNAQNIGKGKELIDEFGNEYIDFSLRTVFGPAPHREWYANDYNQLQLRIFAFASQEQSIIDAFDAGWDFHSYVASRLFKTDSPTKIQRRVAKNLNFCLIFGGSPAKADATAGMPGAYDMFRGQFPSIDRYMSSVIKFARKFGYVMTLGGYKLAVPPEKPYVGTNYVIQGTEGEIVKKAMLDCHNYLESKKRLDAFLTLQVHDELVFDFAKKPFAEQKPVLLTLKKTMEAAGKFFGVKTPVECERICRDYAHGKKVSLA